MAAPEEAGVAIHRTASRRPSGPGARSHAAAAAAAKSPSGAVTVRIETRTPAASSTNPWTIAMTAASARQASANRPAARAAVCRHPRDGYGADAGVIAGGRRPSRAGRRDAASPASAGRSPGLCALRADDARSGRID